MHSQKSIEHLVRIEMKGLCMSCKFSSHCSYRAATHKIIVQCEVYQLSEQEDVPATVSTQRGLCANCCKADSCTLPGRNTGIWRCKEYQ